MKLKKSKKSRRQSRTHGFGSRKKHRGKGNKGGKGMAGSGKRAGQKKTFIIKLGKYFGKQGITSRGTKKVKENVINIKEIAKNIQSLLKSGKAKETNDGIEVHLADYKILGDGVVDKRLIVKAKSFSNSAKEKIEKAGGKIIVE